MKTCKERAEALNMEWIVKVDPHTGLDEVCFRSMLFDNGGIRVVRYYPDPCEFISYIEAYKELVEMEKAVAKARS